MFNRLFCKSFSGAAGGLSLLFASAAGWAEAPAELAIYDTIVVSASPIARRLGDLDQSVSLLTRDDIQAFAADNLAEMLQFVGGVDVRQRGGRGVQADVGIRGTAYEQTLIMVDGVRMGDPQTGHHNMNLPVPLEHIERVEVLKGPGSAAFGPNATGGAINLITRRPERTEGGFHARGGEYGYRAVGAHLGLVGAKGRSSHMLSGSWRASDGHISDEPTDFDVRSAYYSGHWDLGDHSISVGLGANERDFGAYKFYVDRFPDQREETRARVAHVSAAAAVGEWTLSPTLFWRRHEDWFRTRHPSFAADSINEHETDVYGFRVGGQREWEAGVTSVGVSLTEEEIESTALGDHDRRERSAWLEHQLALTTELSMALSASVVDYSDYGTEFLPGASLNYRFSETTTGFVSAARSTRIPSYTELFLPGGAGNQGNADVEPETSDFYEAGVRWQEGNQALSAAAFVRETDDLIDWRRETPDVDFQASNFSGHRTWGGELEYQLQPAAQQFSQLRVTYTYLSTRLDNEDGQISYAFKHPRHELATQLGLRWLPDLTQSVQLRYADRRGAESAWLLSSRLAWARDGVEVSIEGNNLLNERYTEAGFAPLPGRWVVAGIAFRF